MRVFRGIGTGIRDRPKIFLAVTAGVFVLSLVLPVVVLSIARKPLDYFTFNPWLKRLPEYLASSGVSLNRKLEFLSNVALFWFSADNPMGADWGFVVDVPSLVRIILTSILFGAYFALWFYRRDQLTQCGWGTKAGRRGGVVGALTSILGLSQGPCSVAGCGVSVLPVIGLAFTWASTETLKLFATVSRVATAVVLLAMTLGVAYLGWLVSANSGETPPTRS